MAARNMPAGKASPSSHFLSCTDGQNISPEIIHLEDEDEDDETNLIPLNSDAHDEENADGKHDVRTTLSERNDGGDDEVEVTES